MKKLYLILISALFICTLCACGKHITLTEKESDIIAEYVADLLMSRDDFHTSKLLSNESIAYEKDMRKPTATPVPEQVEDTKLTPTPTPTPVEYVIDDDIIKTINEGLTKVLGGEVFSVSYVDYSISDEYIPENGGYTLAKRDGVKYCVIELEIRNITDKTRTFAGGEAGVSYRLDINNGTYKKPSLTLVENDIQYMKTTLAPYSSANGVLVFELSDKTTVINLNFMLNNTKDSAIIKLK